MIRVARKGVARMKYMSSTQAAERIGVDRSTVVRWIQLGKMKAERIGQGETTAYVIEMDEVKRILEQRKLNGKE
jgi:excisionase family DNA binding protein